MSEKYKMRFFNRVIYISDYLEDGLTNNRRKHNIKSPNGCIARAEAFLDSNACMKIRIKSMLQYQIYGKFAGRKSGELLSNSSDKILYCALFLPSQQKIMKRGRKNMNTTLLIMAAGIGSRFGTGIKQLEPVDASNHIIMDYSIHDAIEAGFNHVVFIIRKDIEKEFKEVIGDRIASICKSHNVTVDYAFQDINDIPGELPAGRTKPWGTGQAVLAAKNVIDTPFIVINADDYYGKEGFKAVHEYLVNGGESCMAGFVLKNTLSDNGGVTRGMDTRRIPAIIPS